MPKAKAASFESNQILTYYRTTHLSFRLLESQQFNIVSPRTMSSIGRLLACTAALLLASLASWTSAECYKGTHEDVKPGFPDKMGKCTPTDTKCYEVLLSFSKSHRLFIGCGPCPKEIETQSYKFGSSTKTLSNCAAYSNAVLKNTEGGNKIKEFVQNSRICSFDDDNGPKGTILCEPKQKCITAVTSTKKRFRGCSSNCEEFKLSDCRECDKKSCDHSAFDSSGKFIEKSGARDKARLVETVLLAALAVTAAQLAGF